MIWFQYIANIFGAVLLVLIVSALMLIAAITVAAVAVLLVPVGITASPWIPHWFGVNKWPGLRWRKRRVGTRVVPRGVPTSEMEGFNDDK